MAIVINGSGSITGISAGGLPDSSVTADDIASGAVTAAKLADTLDLTGKTVTLPAGVGGKVLQVVQTLYTTQTSTTSTSYVDISGFSAAITPSSASNKVLVMIQANISHNNSTGGTLQLKRSGSAVPQTHGFWFYTGGSNANYSGMAGTIVYLDSPAITSSTTYQIAWSVDQSGQTIYINRSVTYPTTNQSGFSTITLMEIAA